MKFEKIVTDFILQNILWQHLKVPSSSFYVVGVQFLCFRVTLVIASRSPFGIFAFGATNDELQVRARKGHTVSEARALIDVKTWR